MAKTEQLGIRCAEISKRHRVWGELPAVDLDFLVVEYDQRKVVALVDYKFGHYSPRSNDANREAQSDLATRAGIPFFVAAYEVGSWLFEVYPVNRMAQAILPRRTDMSEQEYVAFLNGLRRREAPQDLLETLNDWPWECQFDLPPLPWGPDPRTI